MIYIEPYYSDKKINDYLLDMKPKSRILITFAHGLGDTTLFYPVVMKLREMYPHITIDLWVGCDQNTVWISADDIKDESYDFIFGLHYPLSEGTGVMKVDKCCQTEIGIKCPLSATVTPDYLPHYPNPIVAVHFNCTSGPQVNCSYDTAKLIWNEIIDTGLVPLEVHYKHCFHNPVNEQFNFVTSTVRNCQPNIQSLIGIIRNCFAFVGVSSGPVCVAMSCMPSRTLFLENGITLNHFSLNKEVKEISIKNYVHGSVFRFLSDLIIRDNFKEWRV